MYKFSRMMADMVARHIPFFLYRLPGTATMVLGWQKDGALLPWKGEGDFACDGFLFAPFKENPHHAYFIRTDHTFSFDLSDNAGLDSIPDLLSGVGDESYTVGEEESPHDSILSKEEYLDTCTHYIESIKAGRLQKAILSRILHSDSCCSRTGGDLFLKLERSYPDAFVFLVNLPGVVCWTGATPETLLSADSRGFYTMSLAGTQSWRPDFTDDLRNWSSKDKEEQDVVTRYIADVLRRFVENEGLGSTDTPLIRRSPLTVKRAGNLGHLMTEFSCQLPLSGEQLGRLLKQIHPTPAVCGTPRDEAFELIEAAERHDRSYYAGFLGPVKQSGEVKLFVNLRCARLCEKEAFLFVGGGITADSNPEKEWEETCMKGQTLLNIINEREDNKDRSNDGTQV